MTSKNTKKVLLTILDGWGFDKKKQYNAVELGKTDNWHRLSQNNPNAFLVTFGTDVGLPEGQMGNSEVGHTNIGAGRVVYQELPKINTAIKNKEFDKNLELLKTLKYVQENSKTVHIMGLLSDGGVHSHCDHYFYATEFFAKAGAKVKLHIFSDGRDTPPTSAINYSNRIEELLAKYSNIQVATISGRYYAMDRDKRWERVELAYNAMVLGESPLQVNTFKEAIENSYKENINDEFIKPMVVNGYHGMEDGDAIFMINYRSDRARQILNALVSPTFNGFTKKKTIKIGYALGMVSYSEDLSKYLHTMFLPNDLSNTLGQWLSKNNLKQLRVAETEKYPHVTFFFSGGQEKEFDGEDRILIPSPKVATYDLKPEMSAFEITTNLVDAIDSKKYDFIVVNYANGDMVGHTGVLEAAIKATESVDECLGTLEKAVVANDYIWIIIADHGNCETMWDEINNAPHTQHTTNLVKIVVVNSKETSALEDGKLADVAPTILKLMNLEQPAEMNGNILIKK